MGTGLRRKHAEADRLLHTRTWLRLWIRCIWALQNARGLGRFRMLDTMTDDPDWTGECEPRSCLSLSMTGATRNAL